VRRRFARYAYNFTGNMGWVFVELANTRPFGRLFEWPYRVGCWFYDQHYNIALKHGFWKINPAWTGNNDEPKYIDA